MDLKEGIPEQWGQYCLNKLLAGDWDPLIDSWQAFEPGFLAKWSDPAALQVAELQINDLKQTASGSDYATELRVIAGELEWSDSALMAAFCRGLEPYVRGKLIELTIGRTITSLDELINNRQYACQLSPPFTELSSPWEVLGINSKEVWDAVRFNCTLNITVETHSFTSTSFCLPLGDSDIILGLPWFKQADPDIDWPSTTLKLPEPLSGKSASITRSTPLFKVPPEYLELYDCAIPLEEGKDVPWGPIYTITPAETAALKEHIDVELASSKIRLSTSPAGAPVISVEESDGRLRLVVDYRRLNNNTIKDRYALSHQDELIQKLRQAKILTKLDLRSEYNNVRIKTRDEWKTAFRTNYDLLTNAPAVFQRFMNDIFRNILDICVIAYLDDILVLPSNREEHVHHVREVLTHLQKHNLFCNADKCHFAVTTVTDIGLVTTPEGISMAKEKFKAIMEWPAPLLVKQPSSSPPACAYTSGSALGGHLQGAVLAHPNENEPHQLETDASGTAMGAVLSQQQPDGHLHPVAFMSMSFSPAELNYDTYDKKLLATVRPLEHWRIFLEGTGHPVLVFYDHKNLEG
ncbi:Retrotransposable element Tf2 protein [Ceratobasidium sp. AG-Ba]|nr:Retrotransposable element Tf2 protein [Ceratobasidium sp. AG-Ba]